MHEVKTETNLSVLSAVWRAMVGVANCYSSNMGNRLIASAAKGWLNDRATLAVMRRSVANRRLQPWW
jgi:hypothetical protein